MGRKHDRRGKGKSVADEKQVVQQNESKRRFGSKSLVGRQGKSEKEAGKRERCRCRNKQKTRRCANINDGRKVGNIKGSRVKILKRE